MTRSQSEYWKEHYESLAKSPTPWLDYSNERVQGQSFALTLEAIGPLAGRECLDVGCGWGQLSVAMHCMGASRVTGIDISDTAIAKNRERHPEVTWLSGTLLTTPLEQTFDVVVLLEVLQYVPIAETVVKGWSLVRPGGRLVAMIPNRDCPIVQNAMKRFDGRFAPATPRELEDVLRGIPDCAVYGARGMAFLADQRVVPYGVTPWTAPSELGSGDPPNRIQFVALKG
jgi:ubiquinone/menaquinone biosynthesis C-methylase UbiE